MTSDDSYTTDGPNQAEGEPGPILTSHEPNFQRSFARGTLLRMDDDDDNIVQLGFWSSKESGVGDTDVSGTGYRLEAEIMMDWDSVRRLHSLLDDYIDQNAPPESNGMD